MRCALLLLVSCSVPDGETFGRVPAEIDTTHFRWCNTGEPDHLDPATASSQVSSPIINLLFDGLTVYGMDGNPVPGLATSWDIAPDWRTFTFHLRDGARWSNGRAVTAYDVAFTALRVLHPVTGSPNADTLSPIAGADAFLAADRAGNRRTAKHELALRDLGAPASAAYAHVTGEVSLFMLTGGRATPPSPDGRTWAYVIRGDDPWGFAPPWGWVPADELAGDGGISTDSVGIDVPDPHTIRFTLADPTPFFLAITANRALRTTPIEAVSRAPRAWTQPGRIVTSGPYLLADWRERDRIELVRSPTYWNPSEVRTDRITVFAIDDQAAATNFYYVAGCDATAANAIPSTYLPALDGELRRPFKDYRVSPFLGIYFLWVNTDKVKSRHLRRALALAIDRTNVPRFTHGGEIPTAQLTPGTPIARLSDADLAACGVARSTPGVALVMEPGALCYVPPPGLDYDLDAARREVEAARAELGTLPTLHYRYNAGSEGHKQIAEYLQSQWAAVGIDVELQAQEWNAMLADTRNGDYEIARFGNVGQAPDTESDFLPLFRCGTPDNRGRYCNDDFERLMREAHVMLDRKARNAKLREAESVMLQDAPVIPIYVYTQKHLIKPYVHDYADTINDQPPLWRVWLSG